MELSVEPPWNGHRGYGRNIHYLWSFYNRDIHVNETRFSGIGVATRELGCIIAIKKFLILKMQPSSPVAIPIPKISPFALVSVVLKKYHQNNDCYISPLTAILVDLRNTLKDKPATPVGVPRRSSR